MRQLLLIASLLSAALPVAAEERAERVAAQDPLVVEIVRMLDNGVSEAIVGRWLDSSSRRPGPLTGDDLIALTRAGASDGLIEKVLDLSAQPAEAEALQPPTPDRPVSPSAVPETAPSQPVAVTAGVPADAAPEGEGVTAHFGIEYHTASVEDEERPWDLFVYLDGSFLARVPPNKKDPVRFAEDLASGRHRLVATQERHLQRSGKKSRWFHEARVSPAPLDFELTDGADVQIEVVFRQRFFEVPGSGPLNLTITRGYDELQRLEWVGEPPGYWPLLCEAVEVNYAGDDRLPLAARQDLKRCRRWSDLWPAEIEASERSTIREYLEQFDFEPPPGSDKAQMPR